MTSQSKPKATTALELFNSGSRWTDKTTRALLPFVVQRAMWNPTPIKYGELNEQALKLGLKSAPAITYRYVAGRIGDLCRLAGRELSDPGPPLNVIIVNKHTGQPSPGLNEHLAEWGRVTPTTIESLSKSDRAARVAAAQVEVW